jgi:hypothetical protein
MNSFRRLPWRDLARNAGIGFGFLLLFLYLTFPWDAVRQRLEADLSSSLSSPQ